jgi:large subunit ribosomal protein L15
MENILSNLVPLVKKGKRVGRGLASGHGKTACRGTKGQRSRSGSGIRPGFEGGQTTLIRRTPKRGFFNRWGTNYEIVNIGLLEKFAANTVITPELLKKEGILKSRLPIKILGEGALTKTLTVHAHRFSASAKLKIESLQGKIEYIGGIPEPKKERPKKEIPVKVVKEKPEEKKPEVVKEKKQGSPVVDKKPEVKEKTEHPVEAKVAKEKPAVPDKQAKEAVKEKVEKTEKASKKETTKEKSAPKEKKEKPAGKKAKSSDK